MAQQQTTRLSRRTLLASVAAVLAAPACAITVHGSLPWSPAAGDPPAEVKPGPWTYFTPEEGSLVEALVDRLIPSDPDTPGGKDAGCAVYIDRQLAGPYGRAAGLYMSPPFHQGTAEQGAQSPGTPAEQYRQALAAFDAHVTKAYAGKHFQDLPSDQQDRLITGLSKGDVLDTQGRAFFTLLLKNTQEGFFADPIYGGNRDMAGWRMIGFPGTRYDFRDWVERHNERYPHPPVSLIGRPEWNVVKG
jgi:gluconate 2-dehydrogenase gamma chain